MAVLSKDLRAEIRNRTALNSILLFTVTALVVVGFAIGNAGLPGAVRGALLWVVLFFAAFSGLAHVFIHEEEAGTSQALRLTASAGAIYAGKLLFNLIVLVGITLVVVPLFVILLELNPRNPIGLAAVVFPGIIGLGSGATIVAAIIAKARGKGALYGALGFPILLPMLIIAVDATTMAVAGNRFSARLIADIVGLTAYATLIITASGLLFPSVWED
jgi:heme exporter protein B